MRHFRPDVDVEPAVVERILGAAHQAPSVGFSQPWGFVVIRDRAVRGRDPGELSSLSRGGSRAIPGGKARRLSRHKLEGILEAPLNVCVAVHLRPQAEAILGTTVQPEAVRASVSCAVQNLWLAARAEGIGVGWVSIVEPAVLRAALALPPGVEPIAYLCVGHPVAFRERPMLEESGWRARTPLLQVVHPNNQWEDREPPKLAPEKAPSASSSRGPIPLPVETARVAAIDHQATLTKPVGSLGRLEELAAWYAAVRGAFPPPPLERAIVALFVADHGVAVEGVSAYGSEVTAAMVAT